ncbi:MAG: hypothetical protein Q8L54_01880 [Devosia sp.]|nr:hypothetical protein [Devosia sp.]
MGRWRRAAQVKAKDRQDEAQPRGEKIHVGPVGFRQPLEAGLRVVRERDRTSVPRQPDRLAFDEPDMGLGEIVVGTDNDDEARSKKSLSSGRR